MTTGNNRFPLLETLESPEQLRQLPENQLQSLADELRCFLIDTVSRTGGHLAAGLGTIELTIALHYIYNTPDDRVIWDVGHQAYPHKILTGRRDQMGTIRKKGGISGFLKRSESPFDIFGAGHASTSISAALGMAMASRQARDQRRTVAVIGDGAMTAGMAFEALNHAGDIDADLLVILNDNEMSISPNVGAMSTYLTRLLSGRFYANVRERSKQVLDTLPPMKELARRAEEHVKGMVVPGTLFEELGFNYLGPVDGHDLGMLVKTLGNLRTMSGPQLLHIVTTKGKGFKPAEDNPCTYHGVTVFDPATGKMEPKKSNGPSYTQIFSDWLCDMAAEDERVIGITPAMREGSGLVKFSEQYPDRYFDVGIAEQHSVTFAAGLACEGYKPVVAIYSTFLQRAYDQLVHDVALQDLPVLFAIDRAGLVGPDGATHAGSFDLSYLRSIPNMVIMAPADENECRQMLYTGHQHNAPCAVRYPRGSGPGAAVQKEMTALPIGKAQVVRKGQNTAILAFGSMVTAALAAAEQCDATVVNMRFIKPLDENLVLHMAASHDLLVTVEENAIMGGAGSAVSECLNSHGVAHPVINIGIPDHFSDHGSREELLSDCGLDQNGILRAIDGFFAQRSCQMAQSRLNS